MKGRQFIILSIIIIVLTGSVVWKRFYMAHRRAEANYDSFKSILDLDKIYRIVIYKGNKGESSPVVLESINENWMVKSDCWLKINMELLKEILITLSFPERELRATSDAIFSNFAIKDDQGLHLEIEDKVQGKKHFIIGLKRIAGGVFIREAGSTNTYFVNADLLSLFGIPIGYEDKPLSMDFFLSRAFFLPVDKAQKIIIKKKIKDGSDLIEVCRLKNNGGVYSGLWNVIREDLPFDIDTLKIEEFLRFLKKRDLPIKPICIEKDFDYGFDDPCWELQIQTNNYYKEKALSAFSLISGKFQGGKRSFQYMTYRIPIKEKSGLIVPEDVFAMLDKDDSSFFIDNPLKVEEKTLAEAVVSLKKGTKRLYKKDTQQWFLKGERDPLSESEVEAFLAPFKYFKVEKLIFDEELNACYKDKNSKEYFLLKYKNGEEIIIDVYDPINGEYDQILYPAKKRNSPVIFAVSEYTYQHIFEN